MENLSGVAVPTRRLSAYEWVLGRRVEIGVCFALTAAILITFGSVYRNDFINYDDDFYVTVRPEVQGGLSVEGTRWAWTSLQGFWHPLTWMSLQLDSQLYGSRAGGYHVTNLLLHVATCLLLFAFLRRTTGDVWRSALAVALFALHPLRVESVAWIAERKGVLSTFFAMLTLVAYARYAERPRPGRYLVMMATFVLGLAAKPMLVTLPAALLLLDCWPLGRTRWAPPARADVAGEVRQGPPSTSLKILIVEKLPLLVAALAAAWITVIAERRLGALGAQSSLTSRCCDSLVSYGRYLGKTVWPFGLTVFYARPTKPWSLATVAAAAALLVALSVLALRSLRRRPAVAVGWAWFVGTLIPVVGLVQIGLHSLADRYTYLPHIGLVMAAIWGTGDVVVRMARPRILIAGALTLLVALAVCSHVQVDHWRDGESVWQHALTLSDDNFLAHNNLGALLLSRGRCEEAVPHLEASLAIAPEYADAHVNLGVVDHDRGQLKEAWAHFGTALQLKPENVTAHVRLGTICWQIGRRTEAVQYLTEAVRLDPERPDAHNVLGMASLAAGQFTDAEAHFRVALRKLPGLAWLHGNLGAALYNQGRVAEAIDHLEQSLQLDPNYAAGHEKLGLALLWSGRLDEAAARYSEALRLNPSEPRALDGLGTVHEAREQLAEAESCFRKAVQLAPAVVQYHRDLAGALDAAGRREEAAAEYAEASRLDPAWPSAANTAARKLVTEPDAARRCPILAVQMARQACQGAPGRPEYRETLATACAAAGRIEEAATLRQSHRDGATP